MNKLEYIILMENKAIAKISLLIFILTFLSIYVIDKNYEQEITKIINISEKDIGKNMKIEAKVNRQTLIGNNLFLTIEDSTGRINSVIFYTEKELNKNHTYYFEGKIDSYRQELQIITKKVSIVN